jgi:hypothetical protein
MSNFWDTVQLPNPVPDNYREMVAINSIPLFETQIIPEFVDQARSDMAKASPEWFKAMRHVPRGFTPDNSDIERHFVLDLDPKFQTNAWNIRSNHHYQTYQRLTGNKINRFNRIVELGGGCGDFCRFVRDMGFGGEYVIWDLPMVSRIQQVALSDVAVSFTHHVPKPAPRTLFVATWSMSETPQEFREIITSKLNPNNYLICYQHEFEDLSNTEYFDTWTGNREVMYDGLSSYLCQ